MQYITQEGNTLLRYVVQSVGCDTPPDPTEIDRYQHACAIHSIDPTHRLPERIFHSRRCLAALDASSRIFRKNSTLQRKLLIAAAIAETSPRTAPFLLPRQQSVFSITMSASSTILQSLQSLLLGIIFAMLRPHTWSKYVGC